MVCLQATQAGLARFLDAAAPGVLRIDLADQEDLFAHAAERLTEQGLRYAVAVHFGGIDQGHAEIDPRAKGADLLLAQASVLAHSPGALAEGRHGRPVREVYRSDHRVSLPCRPRCTPHRDANPLPCRDGRSAFED